MTHPDPVEPALLTVRLPRSELTAFQGAAGGQGKVSERVRSLMRQYVRKRARESAQAPAIGGKAP